MKHLIFLVFFFCFALPQISLAQAPSQESPNLIYMSPMHAQKKWGNVPFDAKKFKEGDDLARAKMASDLILKRQLIGLATAEVRTKLGSFTGYFYSDNIPAYILHEGATETWQLVFFPGKDGKIIEIKIHKKCCWVK